MKQARRTVPVDLDGALAENFVGSANCIPHAFRALALSLPDPGVLRT